MNLRPLVVGEAGEADFAVALGLLECFDDAAGREVTLRSLPDMADASAMRAPGGPGLRLSHS
jgi:hypothetical protein